MPLSFRDLLRTLLADTGLKASTFAMELGRERTLIYKWLSGACAPPATYFPRIVEIAERRASQAGGVLLLRDLRALVLQADLPRELRNTLLGIEAPGELLRECLTLCAVGKRAEGEAPQPKVPDPSVFPLLFRSLFAALAGGLLWNGLNRLAGWSYFMGSADDALHGASAFLWGALTSAPLPLALPQISGRHRRSSPEVSAPLVAAFTLAGGLAGLLYFSFGLRLALEAAGLSYAPRELLLVLAFSLCLSALPCAAAFAVNFRTAGVRRFLRLVAIPVGAAFAACMFTLLIDLPAVQVVQLRGFAVGFAMRLGVFYVLFSLWQGGPTPTHH